MKWASILSEERTSQAAALDASARLRRTLGDAAADLVVVFASNHHAESYEDIAGTLARELGGPTLIGCSAHSVIGEGHELEAAPGLVVAGASLPGVELHPFRITAETLPDLESEPGSWRERVGVPAEPTPHFVLLADPFSFAAEQLILGLDGAYPSGVKVGGLASGGELPGQNALFLGDRVWRTGLVGLAMSGNLAVDPVVAQGCRPVGTPLFVTHSRDNVLQRADGLPAVEVLEQLFAAASPEDRELFRNSLFLGIEMEADRGEYGQGDFVIRDIVGIDPDEGSMAIAAPLRPGQVVQFHLRDAATAAEDLDRRLVSYSSDGRASHARGALLFSCLGRGVGLYGTPNHDSGAFLSRVGDVPIAGFFCNGEIGPVQSRTFLHAYTSAFAIFREADSEEPEPG